MQGANNIQQEHMKVLIVQAEYFKTTDPKIRVKHREQKHII